MRLSKDVVVWCDGREYVIGAATTVEAAFGMAKLWFPDERDWILWGDSHPQQMVLEPYRPAFYNVPNPYLYLWF